MNAKPTLEIVLSAYEVIHLSDSIANDESAKGLPDRDAYVPLARQALLLLGSAYRELIFPEGVASGFVHIQITEEQAWLFRSKVRTGDLAIDGKTNIGILLLRKLYELLVCFNSELEITPGLETEPPISEESRNYLRELKEAHNARPHPHSDPDASTGC